MKKILILAANLNCPGGVANYYSTINLHSESNIDYFAVNDARRQSKLFTFIRLIKNYFRYIFLLVTKRYEIVHINPSLNRNSFYRDAVFILIAHILLKKTIIFFRGWEDEFELKIKNSRFTSALFHLTYSKGSAFIVLSTSFKTKLLSLGVPVQTSFYIETTVADSQYLPELNIESKFRRFETELKILFLSRIEKAKGIYIAIEAFDQFQKKNSNKKVQLIVAGDGPELPSVKKHIKDANISNVFFTGYATGDQKKQLLLQSHIMLFPTYYGEGLPNSILESMLYAMPVITRTNAGISDVIENEVNGYITESKAPAIFADYLDKLSSNHKLYQKIAENNHKVAKNKFTSEKVRERLMRIYQTFNN